MWWYLGWLMAGTQWAGIGAAHWGEKTRLIMVQWLLPGHWAWWGRCSLLQLPTSTERWTVTEVVYILHTTQSHWYHYCWRHHWQQWWWWWHWHWWWWTELSSTHATCVQSPHLLRSPWACVPHWPIQTHRESINIKTCFFAAAQKSLRKFSRT